MLLITGVRERESRRRMAIMKPLSQEGQMIWLAPFFDWDGSGVQAYMDSAGIPTSPVYPFLHRSGECNCGAFAAKGELGELLLWYPDVGKRLQAIEERARQSGFHWGWEQGPPRSYLLQKQGQMPLWDAENQEADIPSFLCSSCEYFHEGRTSREGQQREEAKSVKEGAGA